MLNFTYDIGTKIFFGKGEIVKLPAEIKKYAGKILLAYGGGSIKKTGIYDIVTGLLKENGIAWEELSGIEPNPRVTSVREGVRICREHGLQAVLAVGGGSTIDAAKVVAGAVAYPGDPWDLVTGKAAAKDVLPVFSVLTLSATGSEMDRVAVISNMDTNDKLGTASPDYRPKASVLDPTYTYTVSKYQTAAGTADIMSHLMETYFTKVTSAYVHDRLIEGMLKTCIHYGPIAYNEPENYEARANLMWTSSLAINDMIAYGKRCPWSCHAMEHELSAYYDITHGIGLAILTPAWMRHVLSEKTVDKFVEFAKNVFDIDCDGDKFAAANAGISALEQFFRTLDIPATLKEVGIGEEKLDVMAEKAGSKLSEAYVPLNKGDVLAIFKACLG